jgi:PAS domain S-box-containing protein
VSIRDKAFFRFIFLGAAFLLILLILFYILENYKNANKRTEQASLQLIALENINTSVISQTESLANYLLGIDSSEDVKRYSADIRAAVSNWKFLLKEEQEFEETYLEEKEEREEQETAFYIEMNKTTENFGAAVNAIIDLKEGGRESEALDLYKESISEEGIFGQFSHDYLENLIEEEQEEVSEVFIQTSRKHARLVLISMVVIFIAAIQLLSAFFSIKRILIQPLKGLETAAKLFQPGEQQTIPVEIHGNDEISSLSHALTQMMRRINADTVKLDYVGQRINGILSVVGQITRGNFDVSCSVSEESDVFDRLSLGINVMTADLLNSIKEVQTQHDLLDNILSNIGDGIITVDRMGHITYMNAIAEELTGWIKNHTFGIDIEEVVTLLDNKQKDPLILPIQQLFEEAVSPLEPYEYCVMVSGAGKEIPIHIKWAIMRDSHHEILDALFVFRDISDLLKKKEEVDTLQIQVVEKEKLSSLGFLAAGIAHEINNPIGYIQSNLRTLRRYTGKLEKGIKDLQQSIQTEGKAFFPELSFLLKDMKSILDDNDDGISKISSIVEGMKSFSKSKDNKLIEYDLNSIIRNTLAITNSETKYVAGMELDLGDVSPIRCIPNQINQVLLNLILNAAHSIEDKIKSKEPGFQGQITISTYEEGDFIVCKVSDNGKGLDEKILPNIFDPFFTTKDPGKGSGLGLNISYNIIKRHKGDLLVRNNPEGGADFFVKLRKSDLPELTL